MTKAALDYEAKASYVVTVTASDSGGLSDSIDVTITVTNVDEMGEVTLWASATDALTMAPQVGETITGAVMDPDNPDDDATVESSAKNILASVRWASSHRAAYSATKASRLDSFPLTRRFLGRLKANPSR